MWLEYQRGEGSRADRVRWACLVLSGGGRGVVVGGGRRLVADVRGCHQTSLQDVPAKASFTHTNPLLTGGWREVRRRMSDGLPSPGRPMAESSFDA